MSFGTSQQKSTQAQDLEETSRGTTRQTGTQQFDYTSGLAKPQQKVQKKLGATLEQLLSGDRAFGLGTKERGTLFNLSKERVEKGYLNEIERLKRSGLSGGELNRAIANLRNSYTEDIVALTLKQGVGEQQLGREQLSQTLSAASPFALTKTLIPKEITEDISRTIDSFSTSKGTGTSRIRGTEFGIAL